MTALPRTYLYGIVIFTLIIVGGVAMIKEFQDTKSDFMDQTEYSMFNKSFNKYSELSTQVGGLENKVTNASIDQGTFGVVNSLIQTTWQGIKLITINFDFMDSAILAFSTTFGMNIEFVNYAVSLVLLLITIMIIFSIIGAILQWYL